MPDLTHGARRRLPGRMRAAAVCGACASVVLLSAARPSEGARGGYTTHGVRNPVEAPLADAVMRGDTARVRALLKQGVDVNAAQPDGMSPLHWAAQRGDLSSAQVLVYAGARVDALTRNGNYTPLHIAAREGRAVVVKLLLASGADPLAVTSTGGATALHFAAGHGDAESVRAVLDKKVPVDVRETAWGQTPLMWAAAYGRVAAIDVLIKAGAGLEAASKIEDIPKQEREIRTQLIARTRRVAALKSADSPFAPSTVTPNLPVGSGPVTASPAPAAPVTAAPAAPASAAPAPAAPAPVAPAARPAPRASGDSARPATGFQQRGPSYGELIGNKGGLTPLLFAVREGHVEAVRRLLDAGANINHVSEGDHSSPLLMAAINGRFDLAKLLLDRGAEVKLASDAGATALYAVINTQWAPKSLYPQPTAQLQQQVTHLALMEQMLKAGADPNVRLKKHLWFMSYNFDLLGVNTVGATPFWRAAYGLDVPAMKLLVQYKADPTIPT
ncbi:ankyrin repeat domain-containing protein, partial [Gemmatimonas sp.]|uniref:ankyrin repeat domain-containing protein n=1 Tax=Gemmatimonas sp. TaxID=1962908 RepID=UPI0037C1AA59